MMSSTRANFETPEMFSQIVIELTLLLGVFSYLLSHFLRSYDVPVGIFRELCDQFYNSLLTQGLPAATYHPPLRQAGPSLPNKR
jgi:hypothetical protein